ncbi:MAG: type II/IV secretion system protein [Leptolyngbya sp. PLA1]|nr:type II/IV secretion system protein [Leptolyngbya sp. PLA1]
MAKYNIDDILNELGVQGSGDQQPAAPKHRVDQAEAALAPVPAVPAHQRAAPLATKGDDLGQVLVAQGIITSERLTVAQQVVKASPGKKLADAIIEQGADEIAVQKAAAEIAGIPFERIDFDKGLDGGFDGKMLQRLTGAFCKQNQIIPLRTEGNRVIVGTTQPENVFLLDEIRTALGVQSVKMVAIPAFDVRGALEVLGEKPEDTVDVNQILAEVQEGDVQVDKPQSEEVDTGKEASDGPVIRYVNHIIQLAVQQGASDIHIEPGERKLKVRFRIDGELYEVLNPPVGMASAITSRLKIMAGMAIDQRRIPQDGRIRAVVAQRKVDLRVSTLPCVGGEKTVMRILNDKSISVNLDDLGFAEDTLTIWKKQIDSPHGIILVTGPTGSGKTTTLYASLRQLDRNSLNISTVEDPVEYSLEGVTQTQTHEKAGMTFAVALKALLRQDPDVILLGEIRDMETALTAVQASLTGHLVLSTLHTNDAPGSVTRLVNIGLEPFLVGAAVNAVLAQRLLRRLCTHCKKMGRPSEEMAEFLSLHGFGNDEMWLPVGCDKCRKTGYSGRVGIYELLVVDDQLRDTIAGNPNVAEFRRTCIERGMVTLRQDGMRKVAAGTTTMTEVLRVTEGTH